MTTMYISPITDEVAIEAMTVLQATEPADPGDPTDPADPAPGRMLYV